MSYITGKLIKTLREKQNMTQKQLAELLNISDKTISKWENEITMPDIMLLPVIAGYFDITVDVLTVDYISLDCRESYQCISKCSK